MDNLFNKVKEFNQAFSIEFSEKPTLISAEGILRFNLMQEENEEYLEAVKDNDLVEVLDAVTDQMYILIGTILKHGLQDCFMDSFNEVHRSNMSKLENGKPLHREDGKILKGSNFSKPDLKKVLDNSNIHDNKIYIVKRTFLNFVKGDKFANTMFKSHYIEKLQIFGFITEEDEKR